MKFPIYTLAYFTAATMAAPVYLIRGLKTGKYLWSMRSRLGLDPPDLPEKKNPRVWVHALSLGEVTSAAPLIDALAGRGYDVCLSTTTKSGYDAAQKKYPSLPLLSLPLDLPPLIRKGLDAIRPDLFVLIETDIWPNLISGLKARGVPVLLAGHRLSPRSFAGYKRVRDFWGRVLGQFDVIGCQSEPDRERVSFFVEDSEKLVVTGSLKYDMPIPDTGPEVKARLSAETGLPDGTWLVGGSTHTGEEQILLDLYGRLKNDYPDLRLLIAPRDVHRAGEIKTLIDRTGRPAARRTSGNAGADTEIFLLDTLGELAGFYELADVVFMGKSLTVQSEGGGQNLLEPAVRSKPMVYGPRMHNFQEITRIMNEAGAGIQVEDDAGLERAVRNLLADPELRRTMGEKGRAAVLAHRGAVERTMELIDRVIKNKADAV